jgi:DNA-binding MarR family transcriptional regulator
LADSRHVADILDRLARIAHGAQFCAGLNPAQWEALRFLARANRYSRSPGAIAEYLGATRGTVSQTLIALEAKGYIRRTRCAADKRAVDVALTEAGRSLLAKDPLTVLGASVAALAEDEQCVLTRTIDRVFESLQAARGLCGFGRCRECCHLRPDDGEEPAVTAPSACRCGVTGEALATDELDQICVDFRP